ncbi:thiamine pyrophosphate-dependent enzyme [Georgenia halophila]|uniref:thiamine pyrophosphate-dependent enzyme n=1 Tax=Georgenia halophila TaxID=620889 RepID=UPI0031E73A2F
MQEPAGPTWLGLRQDLMETLTQCSVPPARRYAGVAGTRPARQAVQEAAAVLRAAERPLLVAGTEVARQRATRQLIELSDRLRAPVVLEDRRGLERVGFPTEHLHCAGLYTPTAPVVRDADAIFFAGCNAFVQFEDVGIDQVPAGVPVIHSHPDPDHLNRVYGADIALAGDQELVLRDVLDAVSDGSPPSGPREPRTTAAVSPAQIRRAALAGLEGRNPITATAAVATLTDLAGPDVTIVNDSTTAASLVLGMISVQTPDQYLATSSGSLGWGMGAALGFQLARPDRRVVAVLGDGVFQFGINALWTAAYYAVPVTYVVLNNQSFAANGAAIQRYRRATGRDADRPMPGVDISGTDVAAAARAFGVESVRIRELSELGPALEDMAAVAAPSLIEVMTDPADLGPAPF